MNSMNNAVVGSAFILTGALLIGNVPSALSQERRQDETQQQQGQAERSRDRLSPRNANVDRSRADITDEILESLIVTKLFALPGFTDVKVEVEDGVAELSGKVGTEQEKARASRIAGRTMGVRSVRNRVGVDPALRNRNVKDVPDTQLAQQVARKIAASIDNARAGEDWWFDGWRVEGQYNRWSLVVEANDGHVRLDGEVPDLKIISKAVVAASEVPGVRTVDSDLHIDRYFGYYPYYPPYYAPYSGPYYGYGYPYHPYVLPPYAWGSETPRERFARQQEESRSR